ncbi:MAG: chromosomal replication initiator protein DnaA [Anaerolineales bacterium]|nr:chromosomal replication initiator protein DnaA [Anaerolineales bacterium]
MYPEQAWQATLGELQLQMTRATYNTWVKDTRFLAHEDDLYFVTVPSAYAKDWLENRLYTTIKRTLESIMGCGLELRFVVWNDPDQGGNRKIDTLPLLYNQDITLPADNENHQPKNGPNSRSKGMRLIPHYTFDSFVVGSSNRLAHAAALAASENPAKAYNPLFIYGGVGLGKTHLLHAIGHACEAKRLTTVYVSSEEFTNDLISAIRKHKTEELREKYRSPDVLLLDDIQFIAGKEQTQEELFHTFNKLYSEEKQLVISSDRPPKAMAQLEERLQSRFEWGLIVDIQSPDLETRVAILQAKAENQAINIAPEVLDMIAYYIRRNIRELEGALNKVVAYCNLMGEKPNTRLAEAALENMINRGQDLTIPLITEIVANYYGISVEEVVGKSRSRKFARPRQLAMFLAREETEASLPQIGQALGDRDHTTVMYGCTKVEDLIETDPSFRREMLEIKARLFDKETVH